PTYPMSTPSYYTSITHLLAQHFSLIPQYTTSYAFYHFFFSLLLPHPPRSTLFPYTTLFRSVRAAVFSCWSASVAACSTTSKNTRSEEHTSELQSLRHLVCRLLLEKKKEWISFKDGVALLGVAELVGECWLANDVGE